MEKIDNRQFFEITNTFEIVPHTQSESWYRMFVTEDPSRIIFLVDNAQEPTIACMGHVKNFWGKKLLLIESECLKNNDIELSQIKDFYKGLTSFGFDFIEINSSLPYAPAYEIGIRQAGYLRPAGLFSTSLSILVDLKNFEYDNNWKKNLKKAEKSNLFFEAISQPTLSDLKDFVELQQEMMHRKKFNDGVSLEQLTRLFSIEGFLLFFVQNEGKKRVAALIVSKRNNYSVSVYAATNEQGRKLAASYFLHQQAFEYLHTQLSVEVFDFGRISPSSHEKNTIFLFKNGVKGRYVQYNGEWSWYKKSIYRPLMYWVKKYLFKKIEL